MAAAKPNIERLVKEAQAAIETEPVDLLKMIQTGKLRLVPWGWQILVEPHEPKKQSEGGIYMPEEVQQAQAIQTTVARVLALGPSALVGKTNSGIVLADLIPKSNGTLTTASDLIGKYVIFQRYTGHEIVLRNFNKRKVLMLSVTEILGGTDDPTELVYYV